MKLKDKDESGIRKWPGTRAALLQASFSSIFRAIKKRPCKPCHNPLI